MEMVSMTASEKNHSNYITYAVGVSASASGVTAYASKSGKLDVNDMYTAKELERAMLNGLLVKINNSGAEQWIVPIAGMHNENGAFEVITTTGLSETGSPIQFRILSKEAYNS